VQRISLEVQEIMAEELGKVHRIFPEQCGQAQKISAEVQGITAEDFGKVQRKLVVFQLLRGQL
jgi:orotate phosphoribosyltransferase-like protein